MYGVNLDLLSVGPHNPDTTAKDPHAHHRAELIDRMRTERRQVWHQRLARLRALLRRPVADPARACTDQPL